MAIEKKSLKDVSTSMRSVYQKAVAEMSKNKVQDYAIELLKGIVQREPGFMDARASLRDAEKAKSDKMGGIAKFFAQLKSGKFLVRAKATAAKNPRGAMSDVEEALALYLYSPAALNALADAAKVAGANFIAIDALELLREIEPENEANLNRLCEFYEAEHDGNNVLKIRQKLADMHPDSLELQAKVREAAALATMSDSAWKDQGSSFAGKLKKAENDDAATSGDKIIRAEEDILAEIAKAEQKIAENAPEAESIDYRRKLSEFYLRLEKYEQALDQFDWIVQKMGTLDPAIDKAIEKANVGIARQNIEQMRAAGASEADIAEQEKEIYNYRQDRYEDRVRQYPNDLMLRFELAELYWEGNRVDDALEQFQLAQRQPQKRLYAIVYLGRCFQAKNQFDMAVEQYQKALKEMLSMDEQKLDTLYYLGQTYEAMGRQNDALDCFKQIYSHDITYRDVKDRVAANYSN